VDAHWLAFVDAIKWPLCVIIVLLIFKLPGGKK